MSSSLKARCTGTSGADLDSEPGRYFHTDRTQFHVDVGEVYDVFAIGMWETVLLALVRDNTGNPNWLPVALFEIGLSPLPTAWEFALLDPVAASGGESANRWVALWGYPELARNPAHSDSLIERDPDALRVFERQASV
jgi:hypothetical protein